MGTKCSGTAKCDKKCSGTGTVEIGGCSFKLAVKKGKGKISGCACAAQPTEAPAPTGTGSGSGETPVPMPGSGSGSEPMPPTGGSGSGAPAPGAGEGMQCACKCTCPDGSGECDCDCNCPMTSKAVTCAEGFSKVCPMMEGQCPADMDVMCPNGAMSRMAGGNGGEGSDKGCVCVPDFLMAMVMKPAAGRSSLDRSKGDKFEKQKVTLGKKKCTCDFDIKMGTKCSGTAKCDKKCSGTGTVEIGGCSFKLAVKKGKGKISGCACANGGNGGAGSGSGSGNGGEGAGASRCACVSKGMGGTGPSPPTGSGSGPAPTGSGSGSEPAPPTGSGSGSGSEVQKWLPWFLGMEPMELCVETGTEVIFNKTGHNVVQMATQADYDGCTGFLGENPTVGNNIDPFPWQAEMDGVYYFACGVGTHCSAGGMKAKITVAPSCAKNVTVPWSWGMEPQVLCVETGTTVIIEKTGSFHNVNMLATQSDYDNCSGFTDTAGNSVNPYIFQADMQGTYYFACGVGTHCKSGNMKAMITVADSC